MPQYSEALYWSIVAVDIAGFTDPRRSFDDQLTLHRSLAELLQRAFNEADIEWSSCEWEDRGDGKLILVPPNVPRIRLADQLWGRLLAGLRRHNATYSDTASMQLRVALHAGDVRLSSDGKVSKAINFSFRILDAPLAKEYLARTDSELALIASESFYQEVISEDQAAEPGLFQRIPVEVKKTSTAAWLRLSGLTVAPLLPDDEITGLEDVLVGLVEPPLRTLVRRATGPGAPSAPPGVDAWEAFRYLLGFNAGADGLPPAMSFIELLARQVDDESLRDRLREWNDDQARRSELSTELARARSRTTPVPADSRLHLMIIIQPDIEPDRFRVSARRQEDPEEWPPPRGDVRTVWADEIEHQIDKLVLEAEQAWAGHRGTVALEIVLPRALLSLPVHTWRKELGSGSPRPLYLDYPVVVRSLERMTTNHWHRAWNRRWHSLQATPGQAEVHFARPASPDNPHAVAAELEARELCAAIVLSAAPSPEPRGDDQLISALQSGLPAVMWHRLDADPESLREIVMWLADEGGLADLPTRCRYLRRDAHLDSARFDFEAVRELVVLWDDPHRLLTLDDLVV
jgi:hypothetical protein